MAFSLRKLVGLSSVPHKEATPTLPATPTHSSESEMARKTEHYMGVLDTYQVQWPLEKAARDALQNFYDHKQTLDGVEIKVSRLEGGLFDRQHLVLIEGAGEYDYRKLLHLGGTSKAGRIDTAGGFGEGAKIMALVLLRDYGFRGVKFGSGDWEVEFYLAPVPKGTYDEDVRGLFARIMHGHRRVGNFLELVAPNLSAAEEFNKARDLFYHSKHPHFQNPTAEVVSSDGSRFGFKFLGCSSFMNQVNGCLYDAGQRRHFEKADRWNTVEECHLWAVGRKCFTPDRDRGVVSAGDVDRFLIQPLVKSLRSNELIDIFQKLHDLWSSSSITFYHLSVKFLNHLIDRMVQEQARPPFPDKYVAETPRRLGSDAYNAHLDLLEHSLEKQGYKICYSKLAAVGMKTTTDILGQKLTEYEHVPSTLELQRIAILGKFIDLLNESQNLKRFSKRAIRLFKNDRGGGALAGEFSEDTVWLKLDTVAAKSFWECARTLLHELDHEYGTDISSEFSYALTETLGALGEAVTKNPQEFQRLVEEWRKL